jgi:hypothetical protein
MFLALADHIWEFDHLEKLVWELEATFNKVGG